jgi:hypothetical protein
MNRRLIPISKISKHSCPMAIIELAQLEVNAVEPVIEAAPARQRSSPQSNAMAGVLCGAIIVNE